LGGRYKRASRRFPSSNQPSWQSSTENEDDEEDSEINRY
jgi:hypothetical protein